MIRRIRELLDLVADQRGRPQYLHVRVVPPIETCVARGMDVLTWVENGLVDAITPGCGYINISQDIAPWLELVDGRRCWIYPAINHWRRLEESRAWAKLMWQRGAHGLYLFNWGHLLFGHDAKTPPQTDRMGTVWFGEVHDDYYRFLDEIGSPESLAFCDTTYNLESESHQQVEEGWDHREYRGIQDIALPMELSPGRHELDFGFADDLQAARAADAEPAMELRLQLFNYTEPDEFEVAINGIPLPLDSGSTRAQFIMDNFTWITYPLPLDALVLGENRLAIDVLGTNPGIAGDPRLDHVEIQVCYG